MSIRLIAERYARATAEAIADDDHLARVLDDLRTFSALYEAESELRGVLESPAVPPKRRRELLSALLERSGGDETANRLLLRLLERGRIGLAPQVTAALERHLDARLNRARAQVTSAGELSAEQLERIRTGLERRSGKKVEIQATRDPELLGGVVVQMGSTVIDGSLRARLNQIKSALLAEESH